METFTKQQEFDQNLIPQYLKTSQLILEKELDRLLPQNNSALSSAVRYSCLELKGKKIRPFLFLETLKMLDIDFQGIVPVAVAIELVHVYSLIHDDLPAIDNDDYRRGELSCHKKFNESTAILAGDALLTYAFDILSSCAGVPKDKRLTLINELAKAIGFNGMIKGQQLDIESRSSNSLSIEELIFIYQLKTGKLITFSCNAAAIVGNCSQAAKASIGSFGNNFSLVFQITDDIIDFGSDAKSDALNIVNKIGLEETRKLLDNLVTKAIASLSIFGAKAQTLKAFINFIADRRS